MAILLAVRNRGFIWTLLLFQSIWINVVVPGHTRGELQLAGAKPAAVESACPLCCSATKSADHTSKSPRPGPASSCAICSFAAHMGVLPRVDLSLAPLRLLCRVNNHSAIALIPRAVLHPFDERGPPVLG